MSKKFVPAEFDSYSEEESIPWAEIALEVEKAEKKDTDSIQAITNSVAKIATKESMKDNPNPRVIAAGIHACLIRGRLAEALFMSTDSQDVEVLALRAIVLFTLSDVQGLREVSDRLSEIVTEESPSSDQVRLSTVKVLQAAAEQDTSVIMCIMEFDSLLETNPEQVENPLIETMFTLYVVGTLLREVGQANRASRIADTLEDMANQKNHRMFLALVENLRGHICNLRGEFEQGEKHYIALRTISESLGFKLGIAMSLNNLGTLRLNSLMLEEGLDFFKASLELMDVESGRVVALANLGEITIGLGRYEEAENYLTEGIRLDEKTQIGVIELYAWYTILLAKLGRLEESLKYLKIAEKIAYSSEKPLQKAAYLFSKGHYCIAQENYDEAISIFEDLSEVSRKDEIFEFLVRAELELSSTYLKAYQTTQSVDNLSKAGYHLNDLIQLAKEQGIQALYAEALLARSDMFTIAGQDFEAKGDIERALSIAQFVEDDRLENEAKARLRLMTVTPEISTVEETPMERTLDRLSGFKPAAGKLREIPQPTLHSLITLDKRTGFPIFVHHFDEKLKMDSVLISGFISAITSFSNELLGQSGLLRSINHEGFTVLMEHKEYWIVTLIADQESFDLRYKLRTFAQSFYDEFKDLEVNDSEEFNVFDKAQGLVEIIFDRERK
ncbi:tetratricopeptide repeat protein [Candidatus Thorarchaeota archaeon]|nr:MAG: tetratricopeptide repeat protein [Candidatus Thorarchaeota archaeon]